jgi:hypothetical protein
MYFPYFKLSLCSECCILFLGDFPASEFYVPTFRNTVCSIFIAQNKEYNNNVFISFLTRATCTALLDCLNLITYYLVIKLFIVPFFRIFVINSPPFPSDLSTKLCLRSLLNLTNSDCRTNQPAKLLHVSRRLVTGLSPRCLLFNARTVHVGSDMFKWYSDGVFIKKLLSFTLSLTFHQYSNPRLTPYQLSCLEYR